MLKNKFADFGKNIVSRLKRFRTTGDGLLRGSSLFLKSWGRLLAIVGGLVFCLYYPIGAYLIHHIDKNVDYDVRPDKSTQSATVEMAASIINREVNENMWTPNLPFFFPSYFMDDMPNFQLGVISAVQTSVSALSQKISPDNVPADKDYPLKAAAELLSYPGTIWLLDPQNKIKPVPSSARQYRKARRELLLFNQKLAQGEALFYRSPQDLAFILKKMSAVLKKSEQDLAVQVREYSSAFWDMKADDVFFFVQGQAYGFLLMMKALAVDYREQIVDLGLHEEWTHLLKALENGVLISPWWVRNADENSSFAPNHLDYLRLYLLKAQILADKLQRRLS